MKLINKIDVFSPYLVIFAIFLYVLFGITGFYYEIKGLEAPPLGIYTLYFIRVLFFHCRDFISQTSLQIKL